MCCHAHGGMCHFGPCVLQHVAMVIVTGLLPDYEYLDVGKRSVAAVTHSTLVSVVIAGVALPKVFRGDVHPCSLCLMCCANDPITIDRWVSASEGCPYRPPCPRPCTPTVALLPFPCPPHPGPLWRRHPPLVPCTCLLRRLHRCTMHRRPLPLHPSSTLCP